MVGSGESGDGQNTNRNMAVRVVLIKFQIDMKAILGTGLRVIHVTA